MAVNERVLNWMIHCSSNDVNFKSNVSRANEDTCKAALSYLDGLDGHKVRINAIRRRLNDLHQKGTHAV